MLDLLQHFNFVTLSELVLELICIIPNKVAECNLWQVLRRQKSIF